MAADPKQESITGVDAEYSKSASSNNSVALEAIQSPQRIDVHHHFIPPCYAEGKATRAISDLSLELTVSFAAFRQSSGDPSGWKLPAWSVESSKSIMASLNIGTTILSLTAPGCTILKGAAATKLAREVNQSAASIRDADPARFGFFAALPPILDDVEAAIAEIAFALDELHADGITLYTRYGPGHAYLGHADLKPVWAELDRRAAVVFIHPTHLVDTQLVSPALPQPMIDYPHETTRTTVDLITSNTVRDHPRCKIILSHAGGTFPYLATRAAVMLPDYGLSGKSADEFMDDARSLYYDLALSGNEYTLGLLTKFAHPDRILFGTDFPYAPTPTIRTHTDNLDRYGLSQSQTRQIARENALSLFPRLKQI